MCVESIQCVRPRARCVHWGLHFAPLGLLSVLLLVPQAQEACLSGLYQQAPCLWLLVAFDHHEIRGGAYCSLVCYLQGPVGCLVPLLRPRLRQDPLCPRLSLTPWSLPAQGKCLEGLALRYCIFLVISLSLPTH